MIPVEQACGLPYRLSSRYSRAVWVTLPLFGLLAACTSAPPPPPSAKRLPQSAKITQFYASPAAIPPGDKALLCYGVESTQEVRLEPAVDSLFPALTRCIEVRPAATTTYTLFAKGRDGAEVSSRTTLTVDPKAKRETAAPSAATPQLIQFFTANQTIVGKGTPFTVCYGVKGAKAVSLAPPLQPVRPTERECFTLSLQESTTLVLTATAPSGDRDSMKLPIQVQ